MSKHEISRPAARVAVVPRGWNLLGLAATSWATFFIAGAVLYAVAKSIGL